MAILYRCGQPGAVRLSYRACSSLSCRCDVCSAPSTGRSLVSRGTCVLAEFTTTSGNFTTVTRSILAKLPLQDTRMSYVYDR